VKCAESREQQLKVKLKLKTEHSDQAPDNS
jgi:hypothetical protein